MLSELNELLVYGPLLYGALLELTIRGVNRGQKVVEPWHDVVAAVVPAQGSRLQRLVVVLFALLDNPFKADVSTYVVSVMVKGQQRKQARYAAIGFAERVNTEKVEHHTSDGQKRCDFKLIDTLLVGQTEFFDGGWHQGGLNRLKPHFQPAFRIKFYDLVLRFFPFAGVPDGPFLRQRMQAFERLGLDWNLVMVSMNPA